MSHRFAVYVYSADLISQAGTAAQLRGRPEVYVVEQHALDDADVAIVVVERIDDHLQRLVGAIQRDGCPKVVVIASSVRGDQPPAATAGVAAVLLRSTVTSELLATTVVAVACGRHVAAGARRRGPPVPRAGHGDVRRPRARRPRPARRGLRHAGDRRQLFYSERTIKSVIHDITSRLHLRNRSHAVAYAIKVGAL